MYSLSSQKSLKLRIIISNNSEQDYLEKEGVELFDNSNVTDTRHVLYIVKPGKTLTGISRLYDVSIQSIVELNGIENPNLIFSGQILRIPVINWFNIQY